MTAAERARLAGLGVPKRRADWLMGRAAAKSVVAAALGEVVPGDWPRRAIEIASEPGGMPYARVAPEAAAAAPFAPGERLPISVSISHAEGRALCAATWSPRPDGSRRAIGVDLGRVEPRSRAFVATFLADDERAFVEAAPPGEGPARANLVWCAKEAVLKALGLGLTVDTVDLSCLPAGGDAAGWALAPPDDRWLPFTAACRPPVLTGGGTLRGIWRSFPGFVAALATT